MVLNITTDIENVVQPLIRETIQIVKDVVQRAMDKEDDKSKSVNEVILVGGPTRMPCVRRALASEFPSVVLCKDINPDEVVAEGAAIQAAVLSGVSHNILKEILLMDVLPMSIGVSAGNGNFISIVPRNANIPCTRSKSFFTAVDNQKGITVQLYEGEHQLAKDNQYLTKFNFPIPKTRRGKAGQVKVTVTFSIGAGGMIRVETDADEENKADENKHQMMLMFFIFILMGMLFFLRMNPAMFKDKVDQWEQHRQTIDGVDGLPAIDGFDEFNVPDGGSSVGSVNDVDRGGVKSNTANGVPSVAEL
jgi:molecular chaperone DnaK (HSP70)